MYFTYTGNRVNATEGSPSLEDIAWQLLHVCRYAGACRVNYTVGIHSMLVADLVRPSLEFQALLHDGTEACVGDIPKPFKSDAMRLTEDSLMNRIWERFGLQPLSEESYAEIKKADIRALCAEADIIGPPGLVDDGISLGWYMHNKNDVQLLKAYMSKYKIHSWGMEEGDAAHWDFIARARHALDEQRKRVAISKSIEDYERKQIIEGYAKLTAETNTGTHN
jgi:hypothetical protein